MSSDGQANLVPGSVEGRFLCGDVVRLKTGGPAMVVEKAGELPAWRDMQAWHGCIWFVGDECRRRLFRDDFLVPADPAEVMS